MSDCRNNAALVGCFVPTNPATPPVGVAIHYVYDAESILVGTAYTEADGVTVIDIATYLGGGVVTVGACPSIAYDFETELLCDDVDANPATPPTPFLRRVERWTNAGTGAVLNTVVTDTTLDGVTAYTISAPANVSANCQLDWEYTEVVLCDGNGDPIVRRQTQVNGVFVTLGYFDLAGAPVAAPVAPISACPNCQPEAPIGVVTTWAALRPV